MADVVRVRLAAGSLFAEVAAEDGRDYDAPTLPGGERIALVGATLDDTVRWVQLPDDLGGGRANVLATYRATCPRAPASSVDGAPADAHPPHEVVVLQLDRVGLNVCECRVSREFLWWRR